MVFLMTIYESLSEPQTDEDLDLLLSGIATGDTQAFKTFYEQTKASVYGFAVSMLKNSYDAEDVMQSVYVNLYNTASHYKSQGKPMAWVLTITKNLCYEKFRDFAREGELPEYLENDISLSNDMNIDDKMLVEFCLNTLDADERKIVVLHAVSGLKHREIAQLLDLPIGTVLSKYTRALGKIKNRLKGGEYGDE